MSRIGITDLMQHTEILVRRVAATGETMEIVVDGRVAAHLTPVPQMDLAPDTSSDQRAPDRPSPAERVRTIQEHEAAWAAFARLGEELSAKWPEGVSAVDAIRDQRRY